MNALKERGAKWGAYVWLGLSGTAVGLAIQLALAATTVQTLSSPSSVTLTTGQSRESPTFATSAGSSSTQGSAIVSPCSGTDEPTYGLVDPCIPKRSPFDP